MQNLTISFIGAGNMATSIINGLLKKNFPAKNIWATNNNSEQLNQLKSLNINLTTDNKTAVRRSTVVVLAVKPQILKSVALEIAKCMQERNPLVISIAVGIRLNHLENYLLNQNLALIRCMPNTPALIGCAATALFANPQCSLSQKKIAEFIFNAIGTVVWLSNEEQVDLVAALSGSGPAYFFLWMEALENAANELGLSKEMAHALTLQTALGSARMAIETKKNLTQLRQQVTSPGGTTEKAIESLNAAHLDDIIKKALTAAQNRAKELAQTF